MAVVFDFDGTLMPDSTTLFLEDRGVNLDAFWRRANERMTLGWDQVLAWLDLFLAEVAPGGALEGLTEQDLVSFGSTLDSRLFPGVRGLFKELRVVVRPSGVEIEFFIISGGLRPLIWACPTVKQNVKAVYASEFDADADGVLRGIKRAVTFTEKTRYLFEIHKGLDADRTEKNPLLVNEYVDPQERPIPFENMIYIGDGETDIPCFSLLESNRGIAFGVSKDENEAKKKVMKLLAPRRVRSLHAADYRPDTSLMAALRLSVASIAGRIAAVRDSAAVREPAYRGPAVTPADRIASDLRKANKSGRRR